jgi:hypothetical protein
MTSWADGAIKDLAENGTAKIRPRGHSMKGRVESGEEVTLSACDPKTLLPGDVVLVKVKGKVYLHLVKALKSDGKKFRIQIGNNKGRINGWVGPNSIYGIATKIGEK